MNAAFWQCRHTASRATINTLRCLAGCSIGDYSALIYLQVSYPEMSPLYTVPIACASGISTSLLLESSMLKFGKDKMETRQAITTAFNMSFISMLAMELAENVVELSITGGDFVGNPQLAALALVPATCAGFGAAFPYNYYMLKKHGRSCHWYGCNFVYRLVQLRRFSESCFVAKRKGGVLLFRDEVSK